MTLLRDLYLSRRFFGAIAALVVVMVAGTWWPALVTMGVWLLGVLTLLLVLDVLLLWASRPAGLEGGRSFEEKMSLGDENEVELEVTNEYPFPVRVRVIDEAPVEFQKRDSGSFLSLAKHESKRLTYRLRPTNRGAYTFGSLNLYAASPLGLALRRFRKAEAEEAKVYPSIIQMRRYAFLAENNRLAEVGVKRVRQRGHTIEFDQIRPYVRGDDRRTVNWRATARRGTVGTRLRLMVNQYEEERAQPVIAAIDMGRAMESPFEGLTLLDHSINAALVLLNTALAKDDKAGLLTFDTQVRTFLRPSNRRGRLGAILEALYRQQTDFKDPNYEGLFATIRSRLPNRGLILLFANFDTRAGMERRLPYLTRIAQAHRLVLVMFENTGIRSLLSARSERLEDVYVKSVAQDLAMEKREIAWTLERHGVGAMLTSPEQVTADAVNRYLQIKARGPF